MQIILFSCYQGKIFHQHSILYVTREILTDTVHSTPMHCSFHRLPDLPSKCRRTLAPCFCCFSWCCNKYFEKAATRFASAHRLWSITMEKPQGQESLLCQCILQADHCCRLGFVASWYSSLLFSSNCLQNVFYYKSGRVKLLLRD